MVVSHSFTHTVQAEHDQKKLAQVLVAHFGMSQRTLLRLRRSGEVLKNGLPVYLKEIAQAGDILTIILREETEQELVPEQIPLNIVFEDEHLVVVDKPSGMVVHPTKGYMSGTLANALAAYYLNSGQQCIVRPVHRLDRDTSGLVLVAKNPHVQAVLTEQHHTGAWQKRYLAVATGFIAAASGRIEAPIMRVGNGSRARMISPAGQDAVTLWDKLAASPEYTVVQATLVTGRTHQIRLHFAHIGHPLVGDEVYGITSPLIGRQALHAAWLKFRHPMNNEEISLFSPPPEDFCTLLIHTQASACYNDYS